MATDLSFLDEPGAEFPLEDYAWSSTSSPTMSRAAATGEPVEDDLAFLTADVEAGIDLEGLIAEGEAPLPLGFDWRAHRMFDPSKDPLPESPAVMRVVVATPMGASGLGPGFKIVPDYSKFFLQSVSEQDMEKAHIVETFGSYWVHLFGRKPRVFSFSGTLLAGGGENWEAAWDMLYDRYLRATRCVEMGTQAQMTYGGKSVYGYVLGMTKNIDAVNEHGVPFSFSMLVTHVEWLAKDQIIQAQFGVEGLDGLVAQGDLQTLRGVAESVATRDQRASDATAEILNNTRHPADIIPENDQVAFLESVLSEG